MRAVSYNLFFMNDIKIFESEQFGKIRTAGTAEAPLFCLADVCCILGIKNARDWKSRLKPKGVVSIYTPTNGGKQELVFINEQNLYKIIMRSDKPLAEPFQDWVCGDVLPTIRKTGAYGVPQTFGEALMLAAKQQLQIEEQQKQLTEQEPKVNFANAMLASKTSCLVGELAKIITQNGYKIGQNRLFQWLRDNNYLGKWGGRKNTLLQQYVEQGLFKLKKGTYTDSNGTTHTTTTVKVTGKGQQYFINKFLNNK